MKQKKLSLYQEYKASLKDTSAEEFLDLCLFRPFAFILVKLIYRFPVTPNQISFISITTGIISGIFYSKGNAASFIYGGLFLGLTHILDCCDGMIARLKKTGTPVGRIIDGIADYVNTIAIYTGLGIGLYRSSFEFPFSPLLLVLLTGICLAVHSMVVDYFRNEFMAHALGKTKSVQEEIKLFSSELERMEQMKGKYFDKLLIKVYLKYSNIQARTTPRRIKYDSKEYYHANKGLLRLWNCFGATTHIFMLMLSSFLYEPVILFFYTLGVANVGMILLWIIQVKTNKRIALNADT